MEFNVVVGNPPFQTLTKDKEVIGRGRGNVKQMQGVPAYISFINFSKNLNVDYLSFIIPSRFFAGNGMGLEKFREDMLQDKSIKCIIDYPKSSEVFERVEIGGGVNYFLRIKNKEYKFCSFKSILKERKEESLRKLNKYKILIRSNKAEKIVGKVLDKKETCIIDRISPLNVFNLESKEKGSKEEFKNSLKLYASSGEYYIEKEKILEGKEWVSSYKVMLSKITTDKTNSPRKNGKYKVLVKPKILKPNEVCTFSYFLIKADSKEEVENIIKYLNLKFIRFLLLQTLTSINISRNNFIFIPMQDFKENKEIDWDLPLEELEKIFYKKYDLDKEEIEYINSIIEEL